MTCRAPPCLLMVRFNLLARVASEPRCSVDWAPHLTMLFARIQVRLMRILDGDPYELTLL